MTRVSLPCTRAAVVAACGLLALIFAGQPARAQEGSGMVEGAAAEAENGRPLAYALVRLLPVPARPGEPVRVLTEADGRFQIARVPAGEYRLQLDRIGFHPARSELIRVAAGQTARVELRGSSRAIVLPSPSAGPRCLTARDLPADSALSALWAEARKGVETRRAFDMQHRYRRVVRQNITVHLRLLPDVRVVRVDTQFGVPDSVAVRARTVEETNRSGRYVTRDSGAFVVRGIDERLLLDQDFLVGHCLSAEVAREPGMLGFAFRPVRIPESGQTMRGTLWLDSASLTARRLEVEYSRGKRPLARMRLDYTDVPVSEGRALRLPTSGVIQGYPRGTVVRSTRGPLELAYDRFERVPPR